MKNIAIITAFVALSVIGKRLLCCLGLPLLSAMFLMLCFYFLMLGFMVFKPSKDPPGFKKVSCYLTNPGFLLVSSIVLTVVFVLFLLTNLVYEHIFIISLLMLITWASTLGLKAYISRNLEGIPVERPFSSVFHKKVFTPVAYGLLLSLFLLYYWFRENYGTTELYSFIPLAVLLKAGWDFFTMKRNGIKLPPHFPADYIRLFILSTIAGASVVFTMTFLTDWNFFSRAPYYMSLIPAAVGLALLIRAYFTKKTGNKLLYFLKFAVMFFPFILLIFHITGFLPLNIWVGHTHCESNLKNLGTALEMYSTDHKGHYPKDLQELTPEYLSEIPRCITGLNPGSYAEIHYKKICGLSTGDYVYTSSTNPDAYTFYCSGNNHGVFGTGENYPQYNSTSGLIAK